MPAWTLHLVVCAGLVALLGRLPAASVVEAFVVGLGVVALALVGLVAAAVVPALLARLRPAVLPRTAR